MSQAIGGRKHGGCIRVSGAGQPGGRHGQGAGRGLSRRPRAVFDEVDEALGEKLSAVMWEGPADTLTLTENAQPALMAVSLAAMRVLEAEAGVDLKRDARVRRRPFARRIFGAGRGRRAVASPTRRGCCASAAAPCRRRCRSAPARWRRCSGSSSSRRPRSRPKPRRARSCQAANDNGGGQVVVSGDKAAVERAVEIAKAKGAKRAMLLPVSAPFHCALMQPAADAMAEALAKVTIKPPAVPLVANVLARPISDPARDRARAGRAGHRHGALARVRRLHGGGGRHHVLRGRRRQGADRPGQAHRRRARAASPIGTPDDVAAFKAARAADG